MVSAEDNSDTDEWSFVIPLDELNVSTEASTASSSSADSTTHVPSTLRRAFQTDGFVVLRETPVISSRACDELNLRLEEILRGRYNRQQPPDKAPRSFKSEYEGSSHIDEKVDLSHLTIAERKKIKKKPPQAVVGPIGFSGNHQNVRVIQVINCHKADHLFRQLACSPVLGEVVAQLAGWKHGTRLAQDQVWAKPPGAAPLAFHRDSPYFMFVPNDVVTVWLALDDMDSAAIGPLQYVKGSHLWGEGRVGSANQFFQTDGGVALLKSAAERADGSDGELKSMEIVSVEGISRGSVSIHNGLTWHGSGKNCSRTRPRRGLGIHFVPANVRFTADAVHSQLWRPYVKDALSKNEDPTEVALSSEDFPITWQPCTDAMEL